ncbi:MAG: sigma-70 family RNA polymerase sigma factor [Rhodothermales bacterium]|nr:sigma-70 family RNA polymerase sigma factor [Rhodothermales bacterium]
MAKKRSSKTPSPSSEQDRELVTAALAGRQSAYQELMEKYQGALTRHVQKMVRGSNDIDDLVQECFIKAFGALKSYSSDYAFSTWLYKIATNHTIDFLRKKRLQTFSIDRPIKTKDGEVEFEIPDVDYRPDRHIVEDQRRELIQEAIDALPPKYHTVIVMRHQQEKSYEEIAKELDLPLGTVKAHIFRARALLYKHLRNQRDTI